MSRLLYLPAWSRKWAKTSIKARWFGDVQRSKLKCIDVRAFAISSLTDCFFRLKSLWTSEVIAVLPKCKSRASCGLDCWSSSRMKGPSKVERGRLDATMWPTASSRRRDIFDFDATTLPEIVLFRGGILGPYSASCCV